VGLVLSFIAIKLAGEAFSYEFVNPLQSLLVVLGLLGGGVALSVLPKKAEPSSPL